MSLSTAVTGVSDSLTLHAGSKGGVHGVGLGSAIVGTKESQILDLKTLTSPTLTGTIGGSGTYTTPKLSVPDITDFTSANHTHQAKAGGGTLDINKATTETLLVSRGGTGTTTSTGTANVVLSTSPTLTTPTIKTPTIEGGTVTSDLSVSAGVKIDGVDIGEFNAATLGAMPPVGTIIPFYDFGGALKYDSKYWALCNGSTGVKIAGIADPQTLPDLSNRYLVGFGTEGGGDIGTAPFDTPAVGNASHQINLQHSHTVDPHSHSTPDHSHSLSDHTHSTPSHKHSLSGHTHASATHNHYVGQHSHSISEHFHNHFSSPKDLKKLFEEKKIAQAGRTYGLSGSAYEESSPNYRVKDDSGGWVNRVTHGYHIGVAAGDNDEGEHDHNILLDAHDHGGLTGYTDLKNTSTTTPEPTGAPSVDNTDTSGGGTTGKPSVNSTDKSGGGTSGSASPGTNSQLSASQSIQPRSVRVRFLMRIQ